MKVSIGCVTVCNIEAYHSTSSTDLLVQHGQSAPQTNQGQYLTRTVFKDDP
jgi:hypothetical protein